MMGDTPDRLVAAGFSIRRVHAYSTDRLDDLPWWAKEENLCGFAVREIKEVAGANEFGRTVAIEYRRVKDAPPGSLRTATLSRSFDELS